MRVSKASVCHLCVRVQTNQNGDRRPTLMPLVPGTFTSSKFLLPPLTKKHSEFNDTLSRCGKDGR